MSEITQVLKQIESGDPAAAAKLMPLVYEELRKLAALRLSQEKPGQTLQATALVHEAYLRLVDGEPDSSWDNRGHFFCAAAEAMRRILIESARRKQCQKRGGERQRQPLDEVPEAEIASPVPGDQLLALDEALEKLGQEDSLAAKLVQLRFFSGLAIPEAAAALGISARKADFVWAFARAWLRREIEGID